MAVVRQSFKPEFLNRLDDVVMFQPLNPAELTQIVDLQVQALDERLASRGVAREFDGRELTVFDPWRNKVRVTLA